MKVSITDDCISCGLCVETCPEVFDMPDDEKAIAKVATVPDDLVEATKEACEACPVDAIKLEE
jgi:ferredoxin